MYRQATQGDVDVITGDYLAEFNLAMNAEAFKAGQHPGWEETAWDGLQQSLEVIAQKNIKVVINGGAINPAGLAQKTRELAAQKGLKLNIGHVEGDNLLPEMQEMLATTNALPEHLDREDDKGIHLAKNARAYLDTENHPLVAANAYLGARAIVKGLELGADILICGRVADASPVIGAARYWHSWADSDYDALAGALIAGHLIECSGYVTGSNFAGFTDYPLNRFLDIAYGIAEVHGDGTCVIAKHSGTNGLVNADTVRAQFLYELQGDIYLHSDVKAYLSHVHVEEVGTDRVRVTGIRGAPPPPTTKLAIFYRGGFESQLLINGTGYGTSRKFALQEAQHRLGLAQAGVDAATAFDTLEYQHVGRPATSPASQLASTSYLRVFMQASTPGPILALLKGHGEFGMQHFSGMHGSLDQRGAMPRPYLAFYPALWAQDKLEERVSAVLDREGGGGKVVEVEAGHPPAYAPLEKRPSYDAPALSSLTSSLSEADAALLDTPTTPLKLGDIILARSGDKGANINLGLFPRSSLTRPDLVYIWVRSFLSISKFRKLLADDWHDGLFLERVEFEGISAVHFVVYGWLGRGVSGAATLDCLGKGFGDYVREWGVHVPRGIVGGARDEEGGEIVLDGAREGSNGEGREARL